MFVRSQWKDRTNEFSQFVSETCAKNTLSQRLNGYSKLSLESKRSAFLESAQKISEGMYATYVKLEKLGRMCQSKSLFDDYTHEINDLMYVIKMDVTYIKSDIENLSNVMNNEKKSGTEHVLKHRRSILTTLEKRLAGMSRDFKSMLEVRSENVKHQKNRREHFSKNVVVPSLVNSSDINNRFNPVIHRSTSSQVVYDSGIQDTIVDLSNLDSGITKSVSSNAFSASKNQDQLLIVQDESHSYAQERLNAVQTIESTIVELGGIFQQLAHLVNEQEEHIQRIDSNVETTGLHIEAAQSELLKYFKSIGSNRWLMIKIFGVMFVFIVVFVLIF